MKTSLEIAGLHWRMSTSLMVSGLVNTVFEIFGLHWCMYAILWEVGL